MYALRLGLQCDCGFWRWKATADHLATAGLSQVRHEASAPLHTRPPVGGLPSQPASPVNGAEAQSTFRAEFDALRREYLELERLIYRAFVCYFTFALVILWVAARVL